MRTSERTERERILGRPESARLLDIATLLLLLTLIVLAVNINMVFTVSSSLFSAGLIGHSEYLELTSVTNVLSVNFLILVTLALTTTLAVITRLLRGMIRRGEYCSSLRVSLVYLVLTLAAVLLSGASLARTVMIIDNKSPILIAFMAAQIALLAAVLWTSIKVSKDVKEIIHPSRNLAL